MSSAVPWKLAGVALVLGVSSGCAGGDRGASQSEETAAAPDDTAPSPSAASERAPRSAPRAPAAVSPSAGAEPAASMARIREVMAHSPVEALELIDRADALHSGDAGAEERAWLRVDALVAAQQIGRARAAAETFLRRYPKSAHAERIRALTGVHLRPLGPRE